MSSRHSLRRSKLRRQFASSGVQAHLVTFLPNVRYLTGFTGSSGALLVEARSATFITDFRYRLQADREVDRCRRVEQKGTLASTLAGIVAKRKLKRVGFESRHLSWAFHGELAKKLGAARLVPLEGSVERLRMIKDANEISLLRLAARIAEARRAQRLLGLIALREARLHHPLLAHEPSSFSPTLIKDSTEASPPSWPAARATAPKASTRR